MAAESAREDRAPDVRARIAKSLEDYVVYHAGIHGDDCPGDDTCDCEYAQMNADVNEACRVLSKPCPECEAQGRELARVTEAWQAEHDLRVLICEKRGDDEMLLLSIYDAAGVDIDMATPGYADLFGKVMTVRVERDALQAQQDALTQALGEARKMLERVVGIPVSVDCTYAFLDGAGDVPVEELLKEAFDDFHGRCAQPPAQDPASETCAHRWVSYPMETPPFWRCHCGAITETKPELKR